MIKPDADAIHALLFGLNDDIAGQLLAPLRALCSVRTMDVQGDVEASGAQIIFCGPDARVVKKLRALKPGAPIVVVAADPAVADWLDSIEAGATDYCAAPFESAQVKWILDSSLRSFQS